MSILLPKCQTLRQTGSAVIVPLIDRFTDREHSKLSDLFNQFDLI